jgi:HTH-type transcriptional regulator / antitoxin HigA
MEIKPIRSEADYEEAVREIERLWGAKAGTPQEDRIDVLTTLVEAYERKHFPIDAPDPIEGDPVPARAARAVSGAHRRDRRPQPGLRGDEA